jgi:hypothetical protein
MRKGWLKGLKLIANAFYYIVIILFYFIPLFFNSLLLHFFNCFILYFSRLPGCLPRLAIEKKQIKVLRSGV